MKLLISLTLLFGAVSGLGRTITLTPAYRGGMSAALAHTGNGDTIRVTPGVYPGTGYVVKSAITILGTRECVFDAESKNGSVFSILSGNVTISGITIRNVAVSYVDDHAAIKIKEQSNIVVKNCIIENAFFAIYAYSSERCRIQGNTITGIPRSESNSGNAIHAWKCRNILVKDNVITGHRDGIYFEFMRQGTVVGNKSEGNIRYGLHFMFSDSCSYRSNVFKHNDAGVAVMYSRQIQMLNNSFLDNWGPTSYGLLLKDISHGHLKGNVFTGNTVAIHGEGLTRSLLEQNRFIRNGYGFRILGNCELVTVTRNMFDGNTFDITTNAGELNSSFNENYWSSYEGYDLNKDGFGDVPFHPVRLYSLLVERIPSSVILMHTAFITILDLTERIIPTMTPETLVDKRPLMRPPFLRHD